MEQLRSAKKVSAKKLKRKTGYESSEDEDSLGGDMKRLRLRQSNGEEDEDMYWFFFYLDISN